MDEIERRSQVMASTRCELGRPVLPQPRSGCATCGFRGVQLVRHPLFRDEARRRGVITTVYWVCLGRGGCPPMVRVDGVLEVVEV